MLDSSEPLFGLLRSAEGTQTFSLATPDKRWRLTTDATGTRVQPGSEVDAALIRSTPGWLALAVYGRIRIDSPAFQIAGPADTADRFARIFGPRA